MRFQKIIGLHSDAVDGTSCRLKETPMSTNLHKSDKPLIRHTILSRHKDLNYVTNCIFRSMLATMPYLYLLTMTGSFTNMNPNAANVHKVWVCRINFDMIECYRLNSEK